MVGEDVACLADSAIAGTGGGVAVGMSPKCRSTVCLRLCRFDVCCGAALSKSGISASISSSRVLGAGFEPND